MAKQPTLDDGERSEQLTIQSLAAKLDKLTGAIDQRDAEIAKLQRDNKTLQEVVDKTDRPAENERLRKELVALKAKFDLFEGATEDPEIIAKRQEEIRRKYANRSATILERTRKTVNNGDYLYKVTVPNQLPRIYRSEYKDVLTFRRMDLVTRLGDDRNVAVEPVNVHEASEVKSFEPNAKEASQLIEAS